MKIFADTNVLVSAFIARGLCADLLEVILADHELMTGEFNLKELDRVLKNKIKVPENKVNEVLDFLRKHHIEPLPDSQPDIEIEDKDDLWVIGSAIQAKADILVTGDHDLLGIAGRISELKIISPRGFWERLQK